MRMPGQTRPGMALAFLGMWLVMMMAMMLPSLTPVLWRYRRAVAGTTGARHGWLTVLVGAVYFGVWTLFGAVVFAVGSTLASLEMQLPTLAQAVPLAIGATMLIAGALQFTTWKARRLTCCRGALECCNSLPGDALTALRHGLRLGIDCVHCCFGLTLTMIVIGMMDLHAMAVVTAAISVERLAPGGVRAARFTGLVLLGAGVFLIAHAAAA
jgi:predicted metal-binding membrane protein